MKGKGEGALLIDRIKEGNKTTFSELKNAFLAVFPLLGELDETQQDSEWHGEGDVAIHTSMVLDEIWKDVAGASPEHRVVLVLAALFHDIAKPLVTRETEVRGRMRITAPRHAEKGRNYLALRLPVLGLSGEMQDQVLALVGYHHHPRKWVLSEADGASYAQLARMVDFTSIIALEKADLRGRICPDLEQQLEQLEWFKLQADEYEIGLWRDEIWLSAMQNAFAGRNESFHRHAAAHGRKDFEEGCIKSVEEAVARAYQLRDNPAVLTILAGPSGSGKSTWVEGFAADVDVVSLDDLRQRIAGKRSDQSKNGLVMQAAKEELKVFLRAGKSVVWDATNTRRDGRSWVSRLGFDYGAYVRIVAFRNSVDTLYQRNRKREESIPTAVLTKQIDAFEWPTLDESHELIVADT